MTQKCQTAGVHLMTRAPVRLLESAGLLHMEINKQPEDNFIQQESAVGRDLHLMNKTVIPIPFEEGFRVGDQLL